MNHVNNSADDPNMDEAGSVGPFGRLWIKVLERTGFDAALGDELIDLTLLEADHPTESVGRQLTLVDEPVEGAGSESQSGGSFFGGKPVSVGRRHDVELNTLSIDLNTFEHPLTEADGGQMVVPRLQAKRDRYGGFARRSRARRILDGDSG